VQKNMPLKVAQEVKRSGLTRTQSILDVDVVLIDDT
jgi:hypothetical protein